MYFNSPITSREANKGAFDLNIYRPDLIPRGPPAVLLC